MRELGRVSFCILIVHVSLHLVYVRNMNCALFLQKVYVRTMNRILITARTWSRFPAPWRTIPMISDTAAENPDSSTAVD